jgi:hypothetical protein
VTMRVVTIVTHQRFQTIVLTRSIDPLAPLPLRI